MGDGGNGQEKLNLELKKLSEEISNLEAERAQLKAETEKLCLETKKLREELGTTRKGKIARRVFASVPFLTAVLAAGISGWQVWLTWNSDIAKRELEVFNRIVTDFASTSSSVRAGAAVMLGRIACCPDQKERRSHAKTLLLSAVGAEGDFNVRHTMEQSLLSVGAGIIGEIKERRAELNRELIISFGLGGKPTCKSFGKDLTRLRAMQEGILTLAKVTSKLENKPLDLKKARFRCALLNNLGATDAQMQEAILWQADLSYSILRNADLTEAQVDDAMFFEADIAGAKFCGKQTERGLTIKMFQDAIGREKAYYPKQFASKVSKLSGKLVPSCP
jgi:hypothetical protein